MGSGVLFLVPLIIRVNWQMERTEGPGIISFYVLLSFSFVVCGRSSSVWFPSFVSHPLFLTQAGLSGAPCFTWGFPRFRFEFGVSRCCAKGRAAVADVYVVSLTIAVPEAWELLTLHFHHRPSALHVEGRTRESLCAQIIYYFECFKELLMVC